MLSRLEWSNVANVGKCGRLLHPLPWFLKLVSPIWRTVTNIGGLGSLRTIDFRALSAWATWLSVAARSDRW